MEIKAYKDTIIRILPEISFSWINNYVWRDIYIFIGWYKYEVMIKIFGKEK